MQSPNIDVEVKCDRSLPSTVLSKRSLREGNLAYSVERTSIECDTIDDAETGAGKQERGLSQTRGLA